MPRLLGYYPRTLIKKDKFYDKCLQIEGRLELGWNAFLFARRMQLQRKGLMNEKNYVHIEFALYRMILKSDSSKMDKTYKKAKLKKIDKIIKKEFNLKIEEVQKFEKKILELIPNFHIYISKYFYRPYI